MKPLPESSCDSASTALSPARQRAGGSDSNDSARRASMNAATPAARAPPDCASVGMIMSLNSSTTANSAGVKNFPVWTVGTLPSGSAIAAPAAAVACSISRRVSFFFIGCPA